MTTPAHFAPPVQKKITLRRPDIMEAVQAQVESHYRSELVDRIRARGNVLSARGLTVKLAKEFGFCYGVERAPPPSLPPPAAPSRLTNPSISSARSSTTPRSTTRFATLASRPSRTSP